jgi:hypothetical protein
MRPITKLAIAALGASAWAVARPFYLRWGATKEEVMRRLPGDSPDLANSSTRAITIAAPASEVWKWLVQIGQDRAGFYSYDFLENLVRADIHNADVIVPEWQSLAKGSYVRLASKKVYGDGPLLEVTHYEEGHYFVLDHWGSFVVEPIDDDSSRLIVRSYRYPAPAGRRLLDTAMELPHFIMERKMLLGIKERAERHFHASPVHSAFSRAAG